MILWVLIAVAIVFLICCCCCTGFGSSTVESFKKDKEQIRVLLRQTGRWLTASSQDLNPYIANLHANYGQGYLMALTELYSEQEIQNASPDVDILTLKHKASAIQDRAVKMTEHPKTNF